ncbi:MAG: enoyl-CoA hydratase/isomerase family protein [Thermodesulfobacteriota bacterium]
MDKVIYEVRDRVAYITLNRPEQRNAIDKNMAEGLFQAFGEVRRNPEVWVCLLTGWGRDFSTGHDLSQGTTELESGRTTEDLYDYIMTAWKPTVAAINGYCLAQAAGIACSCDLRFAADDAQLGWPQAKRGIPSTAGPCILARLVPFNIAMEILYTGHLLGAEEALRLQLVNRVFTAAKLLEEADDFIRSRILPNGPLAMRVMKEVAVRGRHMTFPDQVRFSNTARARLEVSQDMKEGILAFLEKRKPKFEGR